MEKVIELINLLQITRAQPQYGYAISGGNTRIGNLAEHHYLVTMLGWQLSSMVNEKGADESHIAKVADYLEVTHYKLFNDQLKKKDVELIAPKLAEKVEKIKDVIAKAELLKFVDSWKEKMLRYDSFLDASTDALNV